MSVVNRFNVNSTPATLNKDFINVNLENNHETAYSSSTAARNAVPASHRKAGLQITYLLADGWFIDQYIGSDINGWETVSNWNVTAQGALDELNTKIQQETARAKAAEHANATAIIGTDRIADSAITTSKIAPKAINFYNVYKPFEQIFKFSDANKGFININGDIGHVEHFGYYILDISDVSKIYGYIASNGPDAYIYLDDAEGNHLLTYNNEVVNISIDLANYPEAKTFKASSRLIYESAYIILSTNSTETLSDTLSNFSTLVYTNGLKHNNVIRQLYIDMSGYTGEYDINGLCVEFLFRGFNGEWGITICNVADGKRILKASKTKESPFISGIYNGIYVYARFNWANMNEQERITEKAIITTEAFNSMHDPRIDEDALNNVKSDIADVKSDIEKFKRVSSMIFPIFCINGKYLHFSVDDCLNVWKELIDNSEQDSIFFTGSLFSYLKEIHNNTGMVVTLNLFCCDSATDGTPIYTLSDIPDKWKSEFIENSNWLKFSLHSYFTNQSYASTPIEGHSLLEDFNYCNTQIKRFADEKNISQHIRIGYFACSKNEAVSILNGDFYPKIYSTADDGRYNNMYLSVDEVDFINKNAMLYDMENNVLFIKSMPRLDNISNINNTLINYNKYRASKKLLEIFCHEPSYKTYKENIINLFNSLKSEGFTFCFLEELFNN